MARKTAVMNVDVDVEDEINIVRDVRARSNACYKCGEHTAALIQEITKELQAIEEESTQEEQNSDATQLSNLEQEDNDIPLTEDEQ